MNENHFLGKNTKYILWGAGGVVFASLIFHAGVVVGQHQMYRVHGRNDDPSQMGMLGNFMPQEGFLEDGHGAVGTIASITLPTLSLENRDGATEKIYAGTSTEVTGDGATSSLQSLTSGERVIIIGDPESGGTGVLDARIIHILPAPPNMPTTSTPH